MDDLFDTAPMYDEDYLYFFAAPSGFSEVAMHGPNLPGADIAGEAAAELTWRLLDLQPGMSVLDLACGHGDLANRLAARGCLVTGLDSCSGARPDRGRDGALAAGGEGCSSSARGRVLGCRASGRSWRARLAGWDAGTVTFTPASTGRPVKAVLFDVFGTVVDWRAGR
jgi:SAM-dependent methyltransferase